LLGTLLLTRAGVRVSAGANHLVAGVADRSCLYWTYLRVQRPTNDLSMGWGSNSQWRTDFRRDHVVDGTLFYNVDAGFEPEQDDDPPPLDVLRHRCSTVTDLGDDLWPYYLFHSEPLDP
ncbi:MAG: hypothetical protein HOY71_45855, partial [Nonomuraea sp.]|nr:hypothetical protein [Nonomuraea sp.]